MPSVHGGRSRRRRQGKRQSLLHTIGGDCYIKTFNEKLPPLKKRKLNKKVQEKEDAIKGNLQMVNQN